MLIICDNVYIFFLYNRSMRNCSIYLEKKHSGPEKIWCNKCVTTRKKNKAKLKNKKTLLDSYILQKNLLKNTKRQNKRLKQKVGKILILKITHLE